METLLRIYQKPYNPLFPVLCMDESTKQCVKELCDPLPLAQGQGIRHDYEYERNGVGHLFMFYEPLSGKVKVDVKSSHNRKDWVFSIKYLMEKEYGDAKKVTMVLDNLSTHNPKFFYEFLPAEEA